MNFQVGADGNASSQVEVDLSSANVKNIAAALGTGASGSASFAVLTPTTVGTAQSFTDGTSTAAVTLAPPAGGYKTVGDVAGALNNNATFSTSFKATVNSDNELVVTSKAGKPVTLTAPGTGIAAGATVPPGLDFTSAGGAQTAVSVIDAQIAKVSTARAQLGAVQNRFEHTINNTNVAIENLSASESRIRDTDMAQEMMSYTRSQILTQAGTAMLAQANQSQQGVLSLLR
jgi:flagellin